MADIQASKLPCIVCNKCTMNCPIHKVRPTFSPNAIVQKVLLGQDSELNPTDIWACLKCMTCTEVCPADMPIPQLLREKAEEFREKGILDDPDFIHGNCRFNRAMELVQRMHTEPDLEQNRLGWVPEGSTSPDSEYLYFVGCTVYFDEIWTFLNSISIPVSTLKLLNAAGVKPQILPDERCCGHDLLWNGDKESFEKLAKINIELLKKSGAKTIITSCAEGYRTLAVDYPEHFGEMPFKVVHITQFLDEAIKRGKLEIPKSKNGEKVTYQDPCRLGRHSRVFDEPRRILDMVSGDDFKDMPRSRENAVCCGVGGFSNCDKYSRYLRQGRLTEASFADTLVTACPKCRIHLSCFEDGPQTGSEDYPKVEDITIFLARHLFGEEPKEGDD